jgi:predicted XRE-type DNA-binding protein
MNDDIHQGSGNVFLDLGFDEEEAANLLVRARLMSRLVDYIDEENLTQQQAAERLGIHQPRVSALTRGHVDAFSIDALVSMLARVGLEVLVEVRPRAA